MELSINKMKELVRSQGEKRVSEDTAKALRKYLEDKAEEIAAEAWEHAQQNGRKTVRGEDIRAVLRERRDLPEKLQQSNYMEMIP